MEEKVTQQGTTMAKAIFYAHAIRGEETSGNYEETVARYQAEMRKKGICEIVDAYMDGSPLDNLIESDALTEIKGMCQEQACQYLVIPTADELGSSLSAKADAVQEFKEIGVGVYIIKEDIDCASYAEKQENISWKEFTKAMIAVDRYLKSLTDCLLKIEGNCCKGDRI